MLDRIILDQSIQHLSKDNKLKDLINKYPAPNYTSKDNYFDALSKSIIHQQLSGKVAEIIYKRFLTLFKKENPEPEQYLQINNSKLKTIGLSKQKINYIHNLSIFFINNKTSQLKNLSEEDITDKLISIKGIGQWTIDMFMMFTLGKTNILPVDDLGIKKAFKYLYNLKELPSRQFMKEKSNDWRPYRTIGCYYLWMMIDDKDV